MRIYDGHTDIMADVVSRRVKGERQVIRSCHFKKLEKGQVKAGNFALWFNPDSASREKLISAFTIIHEELYEAKDLCCLVEKGGDFTRAETDGKIAVILGMEGLGAVGGNCEEVTWLKSQGIRFASLTWNEENHLATGIYGTPERGLTHAGRQVLKQMEQERMTLDVSHLNGASFSEMADLITRPVMASHSNAWSLCRHPRNLKDEHLKTIADSGGLVGVNACGDFLHLEKPTLEHYVEQVDYMVSLLGINRVMLGYDFCDFLPSVTGDNVEDAVETTGLEDVSKAQAVIRRLLDRGYADEEVEKIAYTNMRDWMKKHI